MRRLAALLFLYSVNLFGYAQFSGWCQQGGQRVKVQGQTSSTYVQQSYPNLNASGTGPSVTVYATGTTNKITIYSDNSGMALGNPFPCSQTGQYQFFAAEQIVDILFSGTGIPSFTLSVQPGGEPLGVVTDVGCVPLSLSACSARAVELNQSLTISLAWLSQSTETLGAAIQFFQGGSIQPASGQTVTLTGAITAEPYQQIFNISSGGKIHISPGITQSVTPQNFGAVEDGSTDDTTKVQAAMDSVCWSGYCNTSVLLLANSTGYKTTAQLNGYSASQGYAALHLGCAMSGDTRCTINYYGPNTSAALRTIGKFDIIENISIVDQNATGWVAGWQYDGSASTPNAISTNGHASNLWIDCNSYAGDGMQGEPGHYQADQLQADNLTVHNCLYGSTINIAFSNALAYLFNKPSLVNSHIGVTMATGTTATIVGGEIDEMDVNWMPNIGTQLTVLGGRSENSKRQFYWGSVGAANQNFTLVGFQVNNFIATRPATTGTLTGGTGTITLSVPGFTLGDNISIAGAGAGATACTKQITGIDTTLLIATLSNTCPTGVSGAAVTYNSGAQQDQFIANAAGGYAFEGNFFGGPDSTHPVTFYSNPNFPSPGWSFINNSWRGLASASPAGCTSNMFGANPTPSNTILGANQCDNEAEVSGPYTMSNGVPVTVQTLTANSTTWDLSKSTANNVTNTGSTAVRYIYPGDNAGTPSGTCPLGGSLYTVQVLDSQTTLVNTGNIQLGKASSPYTVAINQALIFQCIFNNQTWTLINP